MAHICAQNNNDSLALIFYERANEAYKESDYEWYYERFKQCGYCMVIVWLLCGADEEKVGFFDKLVERNIESPTRKAREIL